MAYQLQVKQGLGKENIQMCFVQKSRWGYSWFCLEGSNKMCCSKEDVLVGTNVDLIELIDSYEADIDIDSLDSFEFELSEGL